MDDREQDRPARPRRDQQPIPEALWNESPASGACSSGPTTPDALARWYADHLGIDPVPASYEEWPWWQQRGPTVFSPFPADSHAFGRPEQSWMLNLRVRHLDAMVAQLRAAGVEVTPDPQAYPNGRFASTADPEGNPIQLWEPTQEALQEPPDRHR